MTKPKFKKSPSPNFGDRKGGDHIDMLVIHYTGMMSGKHAIAKLRDPNGDPEPVSAHYTIEEDGTIHEMVDEDKRAWHAGKSYWLGERDVNSRSIGIELVNPGHGWGYNDFPEAQMKALEYLAADIVKRHNIPAHKVVAHSDIAPDRKLDPGEKFPWARLEKLGLVVAATPDKSDFAAAKDILKDKKRLTAAFERLGYGTADYALDDIITAYNRRHFPGRIVNGCPTQVDEHSVAHLCALIRASGLAARTPKQRAAPKR